MPVRVMFMNASPSVSVILPSYNYARYLPFAIDSIISQSHSDWELIIVDDASTDESLVVCNAYRERYPDKIKVISLPLNHGLSHSVSTGLSQCKGEFVAFLEADDVWDTQSLDRKLKVISTEDCVLAFTDVELVGKPSGRKNELERHVQKHTRTLPPNTSVSMPWIMFQNRIPTFSCVIAKKDALMKLDFNIRTNAHSLDHWLWSQLSLVGNFHFIAERLTSWRIHEKSYAFSISKLPAIEFSRNETIYTRELRELLSSQCLVRHINFETHQRQALALKYLFQKASIIERLCDQVELRRTSENGFWKAVMLFKDWCWVVCPR